MPSLAFIKKPLFLTILLLLFIASASLAGPHNPISHQGSESKKTIKTIIVDNYQPYTFVNETGKPDGFSVDLLRAVAHEMGMELDIRSDTWEHAKQALELGVIDVLPMMAYSAERDKLFDFSVPHTIAYDAVFVNKANAGLHAWKDLSGKTVLVMNKDAAHDYLVGSGLSKTIQMQLVDSLPEALKQLAAGKADAAIMPKLVGLVTLKKLGMTGIVASPEIIEEYSRPFCFAVRDGNQALQEHLNDGLRIIRNNGRYGEIYSKWFAVLEDPHIHQRTALKYGLAAILVWAGFFGWSLVLRRQVQSRTTHLDQEIAQRKQVEEALREREAELRDAQRIARVGNWNLDLLSNTLTWSDEIFRIFEIDKERFGASYDAFLAAIHPEDRDAVNAAYTQSLATRKPYGISHRLLMPDGRIKYVQEQCETFYDSEGKAVRSVGTVQDISSQKTAEMELAESEARLQTLVKTIPDLVWLKDQNGIYRDCNSMFERLFGARKEQIVDKTDYDFVPKEVADGFREHDRKAMAAGKPSVNEEWVVYADDGRRALLETIKTPMYDAAGNLIGVLGIGREITGRKQAEEELQEKTRRLQLATESAKLGVWDWDVVNNTMTWDDRMLALYGLTRETFPGGIEAWLSGLHPMDREKTIEECQAALRGEKEWDTEFRVMRPDGTVASIKANGIVIRNADGTPGRMLGINQEVTERKKNEAMLRRNESRLQCLVRVSQHQTQDINELLDYTLLEAIHLTGSRIGYIYFYNEESQEFTLNSWSKEVMKECHVAKKQTIYELDKTGIWGEAVRQRGPVIVNNYDMPNRFKKGYPSGHVRLEKFMTVPVFSQGRIVAVLGLANKKDDYDHVDIVQANLLMEYVWKVVMRLRAEEALLDSEKRFRSLFENATSGVALHEIVLDGNGKPVDYIYLQANPAFETHTGMHVADIIGKRVTETHAGIEKTGLIQTYGKVALTGESVSFELDFEELKRHYRISAYQSGKNRFAVVFDDISAQKTKDEEIRQKNAELERFTYTASHDLRSPLVTVKTFLGFLQDDLKNKDQNKIAKDIAFMSAAADKMGVLLDELLEMSRVGRIVNEPVCVAYLELTKEALGAVAGRIAEKQVAVQVNESEVVLQGDRSRLAEIWQNLIENAVKYMGEQKEPRIELGAESEGPETVFFVRDNGMGVDPRYKDRIFGLFDQLDPKSEGSGLGLALVKRIVELYKGKIWVESDGVGKGSCFKFTVPTAIRN